MRLAALALAALATSARAADPPPATTDYFVGESRMTTPDGKPVRSTITLVKRELRPADGHVVETVATVPAEGPVREFVTVLMVTKNKFTLTVEGDGLTGEGELTGEEWKWTQWKSTTKLAGGRGTVVSEDRLTDRGLTVRKELRGPDGKVQFVFHEELPRVSKEAYDILHGRLVPPAKEKP
jgi:hypothetical protein